MRSKGHLVQPSRSLGKRTFVCSGQNLQRILLIEINKTWLSLRLGDECEKPHIQDSFVSKKLPVAGKTKTNTHCLFEVLMSKTSKTAIDDLASARTLNEKDMAAVKGGINIKPFGLDLKGLFEDGAKIGDDRLCFSTTCVVNHASKRKRRAGTVDHRRRTRVRDHRSR